jgi:hypothetical protein
MRLVRQKGKDGEEGCGIACLAMLAGTNYETVRNKFGSWEHKGTTKKQMLLGLRCFGIAAGNPSPISRKCYEDFEFDALLLGYLGNEMHWTVWDSTREKCLDPYLAKDGSQCEFRCTSFIPIKTISG